MASLSITKAAVTARPDLFSERLFSEEVREQEAAGADRSSKILPLPSFRREALRAVAANTHTVAQRKDPATLLSAAERRITEQMDVLRAAVSSQQEILDGIDEALANAVEQAILNVVDDNPDKNTRGLFSRIEAIGDKLAQGNSQSTQAMADQLIESIDERIGPRLDGFGASVDKVVK